jgi:MFS family permease
MPRVVVVANPDVPAWRLVIQGDLGTSSSAEQMVISSYAALYAVTLITGGRLGDLFGCSRVFFLGLVGFTAASLLCGFALSPLA